jgi:hypothetical protein
MQATHTMQFTYNAVKAKEWEIDESDWVDCFVNCNEATVEFEAEDEEDFCTKFAALVHHDSVNDDAYPVLVYMREGVPVAWSDFENECGYVVAQ